MSSSSSSSSDPTFVNGLSINIIASEIFNELGAPSDVSVASISYWLRSNIGKLNVLLASEYSINANSEIDTSKELFTLLEKTIFKKLYIIHYYDRQILNLIGKARNINLVNSTSTDLTTSGTTNSTNNSIEITEDGFTYKKDNSVSNKTANETIKANTQFVRQLGLNFAELKRVENEELKYLLIKYSQIKASPIQVAGDDIISELNKAYAYNNNVRDINVL